MRCDECGEKVKEGEGVITEQDDLLCQACADAKEWWYQDVIQEMYIEESRG